MNISAEMIADLVINIVSILVLFLVVRKLAYKPVKKFMTERAERILKDKTQAQELSRIAEEKSKSCDELIKENEIAKKEAIKKGEEEGRKEAESIIGNATLKAERIIADAEKKAQEKYQKATEEASDDILRASFEISEKLLSREITDEDNKKIVEDFLKSLGESNA